MKKNISFFFTLLPILLIGQTFDQLFEQSKKHTRSNKDSALHYIHLAIQLSEQKDSLKWTTGLAQKCEIIFQHEGITDDLLSISQQVILIGTDARLYELLCTFYLDMGYYYRRRDEYAVADNYYQQAVELATEHELKRELASANNALGVSNYYKGNHIKALEYYRLAMMEYLQLQDSLSFSKSLNNIAIIYKNQKNYDKAIEYYEKSIDVFKKIGGDPRILRNRLYNLSRAYQEIGAFVKSEITIKNMIELDKADTEDPDGYIISHTELMESYSVAKKYDEAIVLSDIIEFKIDSMKRPYLHPYLDMWRGFVHLDAGRFEESLKYLKKAEGSNFIEDDLQLAYEFSINISEAHNNLSQFNESLKYAQVALETSQYLNIKEWVEKSYYLLYVGHKGLGNSKDALAYHELHQAYKDSLWNEGKSIELGLLQNELELIQVENKNELLEKEATLKSKTIEAQRNTIIGVVTVALLLVTLAILFRRQLIERKKLLSKIESQSEKLRELDEAKTRFFSNISHDLRSPLTLILAALDRIAERDLEVMDKESRNMLDVGYKNGKRLLYMADEIMDLTRLEEGKIQLDLQYVRIVPYLRLLTKMFSSAADIKLIELQFQSEVDEETVLQLDPHQFEKIIYNLLSNAIKFTPSSGNVNVRLRSGSNQIEILISDTGSGIPPESIEHIFDRYYQSGSNDYASQTGVGIGLALVKELIELHDGSIKVESDSTGTVFILSIPFKASDWISKAIIPERSLDVVTRNSLWIDLQEEQERLQVPSLNNGDENSPTILIVEDHKELRSYLKSILSTNFRVILASNGASALDLLQSEKIDLIISDLMMPYMDGFELIDHLKKDKTLRKVPVLVISARTDKSEKLELISKGAEEVMSKPFDKEELILRIKNILSKTWDNEKKLTNLYSETAEEFEKNIMAKLERLILKRVDDPHLSVLDLADEMAASERKVYRLIKKISGLTPYELIKEVRWQYLENYLEKNVIRTATEAAQLIGMSNVSSFAEQYEKRFGQSVKSVIEK